MRLDLEADVVLVVEPDDAGVVGEDAHQPVEVQVLGRREDRLLEQVVDRPPLELDPALAASCASSARSRSGPGSRARSRSGRGRARRSGAGSACISAGSARAGPTCSGASSAASSIAADRDRRRGGTRRAGPGRAGRTAAGRRPPARRRRWPARAGSAGAAARPARRPIASGSSGRPSTAKPRSRSSASALSASGSVTPGLGRTWTTRPVRHGGRRHGTDLERLDDRIDQHLPGRSIEVVLARAFLRPGSRGWPRSSRGPGIPDSAASSDKSLSSQVGMTRGGMNFKVPEHA